MKEILTISELAARIKISRWTIYSWVTTKYIPHIKLGGRLLFVWEDVEVWLRKNSHPGRSVRRLRIEQAMQEGENG